MTITTITAKLETLFAPMDAEVLAASQEWAIGRVAALKAYKETEEYKELNKKGAWGGVYTKLFDIAGGKTWYTVFTQNGKSGIENFVAKNCAAIVAKRNANIAAKLTKAGVEALVSEEYTSTRDGFNGVYVVNTNTGKKVVTIDTIRAGGYNVQCLHLRVLVKVK